MPKYGAQTNAAETKGGLPSSLTLKKQENKYFRINIKNFENIY